MISLLASLLMNCAWVSGSKNITCCPCVVQFGQRRLQTLISFRQNRLFNFSEIMDCWRVVKRMNGGRLMVAVANMWHVSKRHF